MTFRDVYEHHVRFVWRALARLGVGHSDLPDAVQDVFVVVHRKLPGFEGRAKMSTWLFGICLRVATDRRKLAHARWEQVGGDGVETAVGNNIDPAMLTDRNRAKAMLDEILDRMPEEQRTVFALFELEEMTGDEIAELLEVPVGTIRSRLRLAREAFQEAVTRLRARERSHGRAMQNPLEAVR